VFHLPHYAGIGVRELEDLLASGYSLFTADRGDQDYRLVAYPERSILSLGNEVRGFSSWIMDAGQAVGVPLAEGVDSLNVVVAGGIIAARMIV
jgi:tRNA G18 (ribose-2'-O)-methylase SpoU